MHNASYSPWPTSRNVLKGLKTNANGFIIVLEEDTSLKRKPPYENMKKEENNGNVH
ncbi:TPA: hypothetical protein ACIZB4_001159 [Legionella pneumophila]|uniref:hypothetical protein n=1 Tax=Legionella pneumophila TaxID=446 RepID=UPI0003112D37|nr:hypothetical protein [Legionella pneumophila]MCW8468027.1 hypothetical protein [Legionella pneumophila]MCW8477696.1 hypothetical protein [Legionella pneumophila]MCZ4681796.1 hypothetical protein [Legionella pneumophila]MCZ4702091.1 hypothetical protein [Legionella pneumophila]MCZ4732845.1 hypothetical protein [Legionella pneumophila]